jgi:hypothetical protein
MDGHVSLSGMRLAGGTALLLLPLVQAPGEPVVLERLPVGPGVMVEQWCDPRGPWRAWVAEIDLGDPHLEVHVHAAGAGLRGLRLPSLFCHDDPSLVVAINGDYFRADGLPVGLCVSEGRLEKTGRGWSYLALLPDGRAAVGRGEPEIRAVISGEDTVLLDGMNPPRPTGIPYLASHGAGRAARPEQGRGWVLLGLTEPLPWPRGTVSASAKAHGTGDPPDICSDNELLLMSADREVPAGAAVKLSVEAPTAASRAHATMGGGPRIVRSGSVSVEFQAEGTSQSHAFDRHPRSAVGVSRDSTTLWLAAVDGRSPGYSRGMDLEELASFMIALGAWDALNLDGGGSTAMVLGGQVLGRPSDPTGERPVANVLAVHATVRPGDPVRITIQPLPYAPPCGTWLLAQARWRDATGWLVRGPDVAEWEMDRSLGRITSGRRLQVTGQGWLRLAAEAFSDSVWIHCEEAGDVEVYPPVAPLMPRAASPTVLARSGAGHPLSAGWTMETSDGGVVLDACALGSWVIPAYSGLSWHPVTLGGSGWVAREDTLGLPFAASECADSVVMPVRPRPDALGLRVHLRGGAEGVRVYASFTDSGGRAFHGELTSGAAGAYWRGWRRIVLSLADCAANVAGPAALPARLSEILAVRGHAEAEAGTLWIHSPEVALATASVDSHP